MVWDVPRWILKRLIRSLILSCQHTFSTFSFVINWMYRMITTRLRRLWLRIAMTHRLLAISFIRFVRFIHCYSQDLPFKWAWTPLWFSFIANQTQRPHAMKSVRTIKFKLSQIRMYLMQKKTVYLIQYEIRDGWRQNATRGHKVISEHKRYVKRSQNWINHGIDFEWNLKYLNFKNMTMSLPTAYFSLWKNRLQSKHDSSATSRKGHE